MSITKQPGSDAIDVINRVSALIKAEAEKNDWPKNLRYAVVVDESININAQLSNVANNGLQAMLAVFVILFFSLTWREALVAGLAIPVAFGAGLIMIALLGYSLNQIASFSPPCSLIRSIRVFFILVPGLGSTYRDNGIAMNNATT